MKRAFFTHLPSEMTINILSRLPIGSVIRCKCVCKSWLDLLETPEFVKSHYSQSVPGLAVFEGDTSSNLYKIYEFVDELDPEYTERNCKVAFNFSFPHHELIHSSANGLLLLLGDVQMPHFFICNPITRDYIKLPQPPSAYQVDTFGFGVSKMSGHYKVVRVFHECYFNGNRDSRTPLDQSLCQVYTLGTGSWRSIVPSAPCTYQYRTVGAFLSGNFHLLVYDPRGTPWVSCFNLETELFSLFSLPRLLNVLFHTWRALSVLRDCLCLCDNTSDDEFVTWVMNSYGDGKSWTKQFVIPKTPQLDLFVYAILFPIKVFEDGDILIQEHGCCKLLCYSNKLRTLRRTDVKELDRSGRSSAVSYTPSFFSLKTFTNENLSSF